MELKETANEKTQRRPRGFTTNGITNRIRAVRRRYLRGTERVLRSHGWRIIDGQIEYVGKRPPRCVNLRGGHQFVEAYGVVSVERPDLDLTTDDLVVITKHRLGAVHPVVNLEESSRG